MEDVRIRLSADTSGAESEIKRLERELEKLKGLSDSASTPRGSVPKDRISSSSSSEVRKMEQDLKRMKEIQNTGSGNKNIINKREFDEFRQLQQSFNKDYGTYINNMLTQARSIKSETAKLREEMHRASDDTSRKMYENKLKQLEAQKKMLEMNIGATKEMRSSEKDVSSDVNSNMQEQGSLGQTLGGLSQGLLSIGVAMKGFNMAKNYINQGAQSALSTDEKTYNMAGKLGVYGSNFETGRKQLNALGKDLGYTGGETADLANSYISKAGVKDYSTMLTDVRSLQETSKAYNIDESTLAGTTGNLVKMGAVKEGDQRKFANILAGSIKDTGMQGRENEQVDVLRQLSENLNSNRVSVTENELLTSMSMYSKLAQSNDQFKGEKGASVTTSLNDSIVNGDTDMDLLMGWGTKYAGVDDRWKFELQKSKGITDPENLSNISKNFEGMTGQGLDSPLGKKFLQQKSGLDPQVIEEIMSNKDLVEAIKSGTYGKEDLEKLRALGKEGADQLGTNLKNLKDSTLGTNLEYDVTKENAKQSGGSLWNKATEGIKSLRNGNSDGANLAIDAGVGATGLATTAVAGKALVSSLFGGGGFSTAGLTAGLGQAGTAMATAGTAMAPAVLPAVASLGAMAVDAKNKRKLNEEYSSIQNKGHEPMNDYGKDLPWYNPNGITSGGAYSVVDKTQAVNSLSSKDYTYDYPSAMIQSKPEISLLDRFNGDKKSKYETDLAKYNKSSDEYASNRSKYYSAKSIYEKETGNPLSYEEYKSNKDYWDNYSGTPIDGSYAIGNDYIAGERENVTVHKGEAILDKKNASEWRASQTSASSDTSVVNTNKRLQLQREQKELLQIEKEVVENRLKFIDGYSKLNNQDMKSSSNESKTLSDWLLNPLGSFGESSTSSSGGLFSGITKSLQRITGGSSSSGGTSTSGSGVQTTLSSYKWDGEYEKEYGSGTDMKLRRESDLTAEDMNKIIENSPEVASWEKKSGNTSLLRGQGQAYIDAYQQSGINPIDLLSHSALESAWGTSNISKDKNNFYGIGAFDSSAYESAYGYDGASAGIVEGAKWIGRNYTDKGQDSYESMRWNDGSHQYATDPEWDTSISNIRDRLMARAEEYSSDKVVNYGPMSQEDFQSSSSLPNNLKTQNIVVTVKGNVEGMDANNQTTVVGAIQGAFSNKDSLLMNALSYSMVRSER